MIGQLQVIYFYSYNTNNNGMQVCFFLLYPLENVTFFWETPSVSEVLPESFADNHGFSILSRPTPQMQRTGPPFRACSSLSPPILRNAWPLMWFLGQIPLPWLKSMFPNDNKTPQAKTGKWQACQDNQIRPRLLDHHKKSQQNAQHVKPSIKQ